MAHANELTRLLGNWRVPERILDLMIEFRNMTNGHALGVGGLAGALLWFGRSAASGLVAGTSPEQLRRRLCAVTSLLDAMRASLDVGRALLRGRYMSAVARIEASGVPVDQGPRDVLHLLRRRRELLENEQCRSGAEIHTTRRRAPRTYRSVER